VISSAGCVFYWADPCPAVGVRQAMTEAVEESLCRVAGQAVIHRKDREHCERFRVQPGSEDFAACVADLTEIRRSTVTDLSLKHLGSFEEDESNGGRSGSALIAGSSIASLIS
jgi:hypothetical protein